jgi:serpin B
MDLIYPGLGQAVTTSDPQTTKPTPVSTQEFVDTLRFAPITRYLSAGYNFLDLQLAQHSTVAIKGGNPAAVTSIHSLWLTKNTEVQSDYLNGLAVDHGARIFLMPETTVGAGADQARDAMNLWASISSHDKVTQFVSPGDVDGSKMMLLDATAFSGLWSLPFENNQTIDGDFRVNGSASAVKKKFLADERTVLYLRAPNYQAIELDYRGGFFVVDFILPDDGKLKDTEDELFAAQDVNLMRNASAQRVSIQLPRFSVQNDWLMAETLQQLGMKAIFDETTADFSKLIAGGTSAPKNIKQRASFAIDEKGSSADGDTSGAVRVPVVPTINAHFDHSFLFVVKDRSTDTVVLMGRVLDPQQ